MRWPYGKPSIEVLLSDGPYCLSADSQPFFLDDNLEFKDKSHIGHAHPPCKFHIKEDTPWFPWLDKEVIAHLSLSLHILWLISAWLDMCGQYLVASALVCLF